MRRGILDILVLLGASDVYLTHCFNVAEDSSLVGPESNPDLVDDGDGCSFLHLTSIPNLLSRQPSSSHIASNSSRTHHVSESQKKEINLKNAVHPQVPLSAHIEYHEHHQKDPPKAPRPTMHPPKRKMKNGGVDIWNSSKAWSTVRRWHPAGVISNVHEGPIRWANVAYFDVYMLVFLSLAAYPFLLISGLLSMTILVAMCITTHEKKDRKISHTYLPGVDVSLRSPRRSIEQCEPDPEEPCSEPSRDAELTNSNLCIEPVANSEPGAYPIASAAENLVLGATGIQDTSGQRTPIGFLADYAPPVVPLESLTPWSLTIYNAWTYFCCMIPSLMVFGLPIIMMILSYPHPQEVNCILGLITSAFVYGNGVYMVVFGYAALRVIERHMIDYSKEENKQGASQSDPLLINRRAAVKHWVLLPQYCEDIDVVAMSLKSISNASIASSSIGVVLAMEEREKDAEKKANTLRASFEHCFTEILITYHPDGLPNDPPGKASNNKWAYESLLQHLQGSTQDLSSVILTVGDADSEFHESYFEALTDQYLNNPPEFRNLRIYQAPIFHVKNYHRQPTPVSVGTMFTALQELSCIGDPNAVRFAYSTYSIPLELAWRVGGWDAEWIGEDWHMSLKCFLFTVGISSVEPVHLPIINYTPEGDTYFRTLLARWSQAKRHALGFSDVAYYFSMLPLIFNYGVSKSGQHGGVHLRAFWDMAGSGLCVLVKMINVHVILGIMAFYTFLNIALRYLLVALLSRDKHIWLLFDRTESLFTCLVTATLVLGSFVTMMFVWAYRLVRDRIESDENGSGNSITHRNSFLHWIYGSLSFLIAGPFYFTGLGLAVWRAALKTMTNRHFEYEVAAKPAPVVAFKPFAGSS